MSQSTPNCLPLSTGPCSTTLKLNSLFKVCCPAGQMYYLPSTQCVQPNSYNCDSVEKVCCALGQKMEYIRGQYVCVSGCSWTSWPLSSLFCQQQYCNKENKTAIVGAIPQGQWKLMSFDSRCCFGMSSSNFQCETNNQTCLSHFSNRGWGICCPVGQFVSSSTLQCSSTCNGRVLFNSVCVSAGMALDLSAIGGKPGQIGQFSVCNGIALSPNLPVCCPVNFYIKDNRGCQYCLGKIFTMIGYQQCCTPK